MVVTWAQDLGTAYQTKPVSTGGQKTVYRYLPLMYFVRSTSKTNGILQLEQILVFVVVAISYIFWTDLQQNIVPTG